MFEECTHLLLNIIDYTKKSRNIKGTKYGKIQCFQFDKIRMALDSIQKTHGYPARMHHTVAFFDLIMFSIPFNTKLWIDLTKQIWNGEPIMEAWLGTIDYYYSQIKRKTNFHAWRWRKVVIHDIPNEVLNQVLNAIPFRFDSAAWDFVQKTTLREWYLFDNLVDLSGINDKIIVCNWDRIVAFLNKYGY